MSMQCSQVSVQRAWLASNAVKCQCRESGWHPMQTSVSAESMAGIQCSQVSVQREWLPSNAVKCHCREHGLHPMQSSVTAQSMACIQCSQVSLQRAWVAVAGFRRDNLTLFIIMTLPCILTVYCKDTKQYSIKGKIFYGQEPPSGESTTTECGVNYQLLAVMYWSSPMGNSYMQSTTTSYGHCSQRRYIQLTGHTPTLMGSTPWAPRA